MERKESDGCGEERAEGEEKEGAGERGKRWKESHTRMPAGARPHRERRKGEKKQEDWEEEKTGGLERV